VTTFALIDFAHGRASLKVKSENGAMSLGRWHSTHALLNIGATSLLNVTSLLELALEAVSSIAEIPSAAKTETEIDKALFISKLSWRIKQGRMRRPMSAIVSPSRR
jgi:hypothetical protein